MATLTIGGQKVTVGDEFLSLSPDEQNAAVEEIAGSLGDRLQPAARPQVTPQAMAAPQTTPAAPQGRWNGAAEAIVNDMGAGMQGVNPVAMQQQAGNAVGVLRDEPGIGQYVDVDGTREPIENYPPDRYATRMENGASYIYPRNTSEGTINESRAASAGRLAGYGVVAQIPKAATEAQRMSQAADDLGITPSLAMRGPAAAQVAAGGESFFGTAGPMKADSARVVDEIAGAAGRIASKAGTPGNPQEAGAAIQKGAATFIDKFKTVEGRLYDKVDTFIAPATIISAPESVGMLTKETGKFADLPAISKSVGAPEMVGWMEDLQSGKLTWEAARALRTKLGEAIGSITGPLANKSQGNLKYLYGALSRDLDAAAKAAGPEAVQAWNRATKYTAAANKRIEESLKRVTGAPSAEAAYSSLVGMTAEGSSRANAKALNGLMRSLPKSERATVSATIIRRMGRATNGAQNAEGDLFSAGTFMKNWNAMAPEARNIVAANGMDPGVGRELTKLAKIIEAKDVADSARNTSGTAGGAMVAATTASAFTLGVPATVAAVVGANLSARALTSVRFLRSVNAAVAGKPGALQAIANGKGPLAVEAANLLRLQAAETSQPLGLPAPAQATR